ncbi:MAG: ATP-binding protein [Prolixibacteraceae bacterium]|jgi:serine/threonine-protein kinase RsbW|nr:ATP-binding protein [Prolixibacteraceae bacterium]
MEEKRKKITLKNSIEELPQLAIEIEELSEEWELPMALGMNLNLVLEEAITNIIFYAFNDENEHEITIILLIKNNEFIITIEDEGIAFDPTAKKDPDIALAVEDRPIGGLGIFLISKIMDHVSYKREQNKNMLILKKNI